jgi:aspartate racemase
MDCHADHQFKKEYSAIWRMQMKTIGLLGGLSWESSKEYYRIINEKIKERLGGFNSAKILMYSVNFEEILVLQRQNRWQDITAILVDAARRLEAGGADFILLCTNTMHKMAEEIQAGIKVPFLHIADAAAAQIKASSLTKVGLLGTRFTMEEEFYKGRLAALHGLEVLIPGESDREIINRVIYGELVQGRIDEVSRQEFLRIIKNLGKQGAQGIILGCTEIGLLVRQQDVAIPLFDTALIHAQAAVDLALS